LDFRNLTELTEFEIWLKDLPGVSEEAIEQAGGLISYLEEMGIAVAGIDLEGLVS
jgi:hypothetical protein